MAGISEFQFSESHNLADSGEKKPGVLSFEAMNIVRPGAIHFAILR